jgi:aspartate-semialdehyde dehydrogenase
VKLLAQMPYLLLKSEHANGHQSQKQPCSSMPTFLLLGRPSCVLTDYPAQPYSNFLASVQQITHNIHIPYIKKEKTKQNKKIRKERHEIWN